MLAKRKNAYGAGLWGLPGGRVADDESIEQTFRRELDEETGVQPIEYHLAGVIKEWQVDAFFIHFIFVCRQWRGEIADKEPDKSGPWQWFDLDHLPTGILPGHLAGIKLASKNSETLQLIEI